MVCFQDRGKWFHVSSGEEGGPGGRVAEDLVAADEVPLAAGDELGMRDEPGGADGLRSEAKMRDGDGAGFLGVVDEVALGEEVGLFADDLDGVFVRADGAVGAETDEDAAAHAGGLEFEVVVPRERGVGDVVVDADGEAVLRAGGVEVGEDRLGHGRGELLRAETVAAAENARGRDGGGMLGAGEGGEHRHEQGFADGAGLLGAVEHAEGADGRRDRCEEGGDGERLEEADGDHADALAGGVEVVGGGLEGLDAGAHADDDALGLRVAVVVDERIPASGEIGELVHARGDDAGEGVDEGVNRFAALEVDVGILRGAVDLGAVGREGAAAEGGEGLLVDHGAEDVVGERADLGDLVRGAEAVEEVDDGQATLERGGVGDEGEVLGFLGVVGAEEGATGLAAGHDILVVAEDGEALGGEGAGGDVEGEGEEFAGDLVEIGHHQQEALRGGEGGGERAAEETAVDGAGHAAFGLELNDFGNFSPDVGFAGGGPLIAGLGHRGGRRDRVDGDELAEPMGDGGDGLVGVAGHVFGIGAGGELGGVGGERGGRGGGGHGRGSRPTGRKGRRKAPRTVPKYARRGCARVGGGGAEIGARSAQRAAQPFSPFNPCGGASPPSEGRKKAPVRHAVASGAEKKIRMSGVFAAYAMVSVTGMLPLVAWE
jgi:hypothetical protein